MTFQVDTTDRRKERTEGGENLKELGKETEKQKRASQVDPFRASFQMACTLHLTSRHGLPSAYMPVEPKYVPAGHATQTAEEEPPVVEDGGVTRGCSRPFALSHFSLSDHRQRRRNTLAKIKMHGDGE
jgi:hypothetical protein